jgi:putative ABC transport system permease protein
MFFRLLMESFRHQRRRKMLAGIAILLGTTAVTAMLALATTIGDRIHKELAVYGANIIVYPKADQLEVKVGGVDIKPASSGAYLDERELQKLKAIFWANNITGISPELSYHLLIPGNRGTVNTEVVGVWFKRSFGVVKNTGAPELHPSWKITGNWPEDDISSMFIKGNPDDVPGQIVVGKSLAERLGLHVNDDLRLLDFPVPHYGPNFLSLMTFRVTGIVSSDDDIDTKLLMPLQLAQTIFANSPLQPETPAHNFNAISRVEISARTKPEDAFARKDPDSLSPKDHEIWYCRPYANSIAYQIREAIPGAEAEQVRRVEQSEGNVLNRISGLMWLISAAALLAAGFAVSAAMATAILERRGEIGLMRSLGASKGAIAFLFYAETGLLAIFAGSLGYLAGSGLAAWLGARIFRGDGGVTESILIPVLLPVVVALALVVAIAGSTPSIRAALRMEPSAILREDA